MEGQLEGSIHPGQQQASATPAGKGRGRGRKGAKSPAGAAPPSTAGKRRTRAQVRVYLWKPLYS